MSHRLLFATVSLVVVFISLTVAGPASAEVSRSLGTAEESPIAVPFVGDYEVWCTDRNPAPGNRCRSHHGSPAIDLGMDPGTPLHAAGNGVVIDADDFCPSRGFCNNGKGNSVIIEHPDGRLSRYLHMAAVSVENGQQVTVGQPIGTSGESGQSSSPHLHYDEHFPVGTRDDMGAWIGCVDGQQIRYPDIFGTTDWNLVPYGSRVVNDGWGCLGGVDPDIAVIEPPRVLSGTTHYGITSSTGNARITYEVSIDANNGTAPEVVTMNGTKLLRRLATAPVSIRIREVGGSWSEAVTYDPAEAEALAGLADCLGIHATSASLTGTPAVDVIVGTNGADTIDARGGDDIICAGGGDDTIAGGRGRDRILGGDGNDTISGGIGYDIIRGEGGNDRVRGGEGNDEILGGQGNDTLEGNAGRDEVFGGAGNDTIIGGIGHDQLLGMAGDDILYGRNGRDALAGGAGTDQLFGNNGRDFLDGGAGPDRLSGGDLVDTCLADTTDADVVGCER